jgi:hypothetical protein
MRHPLSTSGWPGTPQAPGHSACWRASGTTPGAEDPPTEASEAPAKEAMR